jgi:hypothetical protein
MVCEGWRIKECFEASRLRQIGTHDRTKDQGNGTDQCDETAGAIRRNNWSHALKEQQDRTADAEHDPCGPSKAHHMFLLYCPPTSNIAAVS